MTSCYRAAKVGTTDVRVNVLKQGFSAVINVVKHCMPIEMMPWEASSNPSENLSDGVCSSREKREGRMFALASSM